MSDQEEATRKLLLAFGWTVERVSLYDEEEIAVLRAAITEAMGGSTTN